MIKLLKLEFLKMVSYRPMVVLFLTYFVILIALGSFSSQIEMSVNNEKINLENLGAYNFPALWQFAAWFALVLKLFLGVLVIFNVCNEYSYKTIKQNLIDGLSKLEFFFAKLMGSIIFALLSALIFALMVFILGSVFSKSDAVFTQGIEFLGYYALNLIVFFSILIFLSILTKRSVFAILIVVVWWIIEFILNSVEATIRVIPQLKKSGENGSEIKPEEIENIFLFTDYLPMNALSKLVQFPKADLLKFLQGEPVFSLKPTEISIIVVVVLYFVIFNLLSFLLLKKRDL